MATILIIEDHPEWLEIISTILQDNGYTCLTATTVQRAISHLESTSTIGLVMLDLRLGNDWGFNIIKYLNRYSRFRHVPVLICSALRESQLVVETIRLGAQDYVLKPFKIESLLEKIQKLLNANRGIIQIASGEKLRTNLLMKTLTNRNYLVRPTASGCNALAELHINPSPGMLISDLQLPDMYGLSLLAEAKTRCPETAVLMITPRNAKKRFERFISSGANGIIRFPFNNEELISTIERHYPEHLRGVDTPAPDS